MSFAGSLGTGAVSAPFDLDRAVTVGDPASGRIRTDESGPLRLAAGPGAVLASLGPDLLLAGRARLYGTAELRSALNLSSTGPEDAATLLLLAYRAWGLDFADRVPGTLACAIWDAAARRLILVRDSMGVEPLHYTRSAGRWLFAPMPSALLTDPEVTPAPDMETLALSIAELPVTGSATGYAGIRRVLPGHATVIADDTVREHRHWHPDRIPTLRLASRADHVAAVTETLEKAVAFSLPPSGPVAAELSAGFDSGAVTALAARILARQGRRLVAYTGVPARAIPPDAYPGLLTDEGDLAAALAARFANVEHVRVPGNQGSLFADCDRRRLTYEQVERMSPNGIWSGAILRDARRRRIPVLLEGGAGNVTFSYHGLYHLCALAGSGRFVSLARAVWSLGRHGNPTRLGLANHALAPWVPLAPVRMAKRLTGRRAPTGLDDLALNPETARRTGVLDRLLAGAHEDVRAMRGDGRSWRVAMLGDPGVAAGVRRVSGVDVRDPTADRRVVELCLSIPDDRYLDLETGETRAIARDLLRGLVPDTVVATRQRSIQSADWPDRLHEARADIEAEIAWMEASPLARHFLDVPRLRRLVDQWPDRGWDGHAMRAVYLGTLCHALGVSRFLRQFDQGNRPAAPSEWEATP